MGNGAIDSSTYLHAFITDKNHSFVSDVGPLGGATSIASAVNDSGQIVGASQAGSFFVHTKGVVAVEREQLALPSQSIDFICDVLANGRRIKVSTIVDDFTKESIDLVSEHDISGQYVGHVLERASNFAGCPMAICTDQEPESRARRWISRLKWHPAQTD